ncbi:hypothetical protein [Ancylobacter terrae]|uniref:hypothetical protein n=1 Tax=Ancylobacter sp. sgz301288 TaxID=3342077 RepID=UPI00385DC09D
MAEDQEAEEAGSSRGYILYAIAQSISSTGTWMQRLAIGWLAWDLTQSTSWVGAMALTEIVAALWVAPLAGLSPTAAMPYASICCSSAAASSSRSRSVWRRRRGP